MSQNISHVCLMCNEKISSKDELYSRVETTDGSEYFAHDQCIEAIRLFITSKKPLPALDGEVCSDIVFSLYFENWFTEPRTLSDVSEKIKQKGYNYNAATISNVLRSLTRHKVLTREGKPRTYSYIQKKPPSRQLNGGE